VIELGKYRLKYVSELVQQSTVADFEKTMVLRPDLMRKSAEQQAAKGVGDTQPGVRAADFANQPPGTVPPPAPSQPSGQAEPPRAVIQILNGANAGRELELTKTLTTLGKPGVQVAVIARRPHGYFITHVEGATFPVVSGQALEASKPHPLNDHDIVELGGVKMEFFFKT
jgi:hypothetical protein